MDDEMFSMLNKPKKVKKSKRAQTDHGETTSKTSGKRRSRSKSADNSLDSQPKGADGPSDRKKAKVVVSPVAEETADPMEALERNNGQAQGDVTIGDETMDGLRGTRRDDPDAGDVTIEGDGEAANQANAQMPVVTDDFEQEAEREVAATSGFAKVEEGEKMRLVHQVRHQVRPCVFD